jgi:hypothetical protein
MVGVSEDDFRMALETKIRHGLRAVIIAARMVMSENEIRKIFDDELDRPKIEVKP